ncbi:hypothetical protein [Pseudomonas phage 98PfluR60PP]|uniref:Uncharacterized protein n=1 Tax=Pseudomonas phage 98PfluR60PP TaxID=2163965 RepID=A0A2S1PFW4_9CAUD|nr:hypothetical protein PP760_gp39 [Pseudomonas phage 98PfluR60PP]AWH15471.1 hypothetical protein [Pseudomonas phage 98PfluR60PP]
MQIKLAEVDIRAGIALYLTSRGITGVTAENLQVTFTAGRKGSGLTAEVVTNPSQTGQAEGNTGKPVTKEKSLADLPNALGGEAGQTSGVAGADVAAKQLEAVREASEEPAPVAKAEEPTPEPVPETKATAETEGTSLFS